MIECRAPAGGSTVIPPYPVSDASILLSPNLGIAYDSNTALAATADTNFGTSIAGKTCNDGTVAVAVADIGIDSGSFMSFCGVTNAAAANTMGGAEGVVAAARYSVGDRNILTHFRHATPVQNQRLSPLFSGRGVWFGMRSGTTAGTNWKVWQVHGSDAPLVPGYVQPIVVNGTGAAEAPTAAQNAAAVWGQALADGLPAEDLLTLAARFLLAKASGHPTAPAIRDLADTKDSLTFTLDPDGNRTPVLRDPT